MEPLAALGLAGNVVQFVHFVSGLLASGKEIYASQDGASQRIVELESVYEKLRRFGIGLRNAANTQEQGGTKKQSILSLYRLDSVQTNFEMEALQELASECSHLCEQLLDVVRKLRVPQASGRKFKSFLAALKFVGEKSKIEDLESRMDRFHKSIIIHFLPLLGKQQSDMIRALNSLRDESLKLRLDREEKLDIASTKLQECERKVPLTQVKPSISTQILHDSNGRPLDPREKSSASLAVNSGTRIAGSDDLRQSLPPSNTGSASQFQEFMALSESSTLELEQLQSLAESISGLVLVDKDLMTIAQEQAFLTTLNFPARHRRHDAIPMAHRHTFEWTLEPTEKTQCDIVPEKTQGDIVPEEKRLYDWLIRGDGLFWVSGKAGSGKSTFMKFVADHETTRRNLEIWAAQKKLVVASHYFWTAGTEMQKSQQGLLQTLLFDIFRTCPELMPEICPQRWSKTSAFGKIWTDGSKQERGDSTYFDGLATYNAAPWTNQELTQTLRSLSRRSTSLQTRYCIFIDGIDEFEGEHFELCRLLEDFSSSPNFKLCLSSRPWNVFEDAFGKEESHKLYIHHLTKSDILVYAQDRMAQSERWNSAYLSPTHMQSIITEISERADGVFLWVFLVTNSLRDGIINGDTIVELQRRLRSFPTSLESFFKHMLDIIDPFYQQRMARTLQLAVNAKDAFPIIFYRIHEYEDEDEDYALNDIEIESLLLDTRVELEQCQRRINGRCGGLLEVKNDRVEFLHRTVRDFLLTREMNDYLSHKGGSDFKVNLSTLKIFVFLFRHLAQKNGSILLAEDTPHWKTGLKYANDALEESEESTLRHLDMVEDIYVGADGIFDSCLLNVSLDYIFRSEILSSGVDRFVSFKLRESAAYFDHCLEPPLQTAMGQEKWSRGHVRIMAQLLQHSQDPNSGGPMSPWCEFIRRTCAVHQDHNFGEAMDHSLFSTFLQHGALRTVRVHPSLDPLGIAVCEREELQEGSGLLLPCSHFIMALFSHKESHKQAQKCLATLEDFFNGGTPQEIEAQIDDVVGTLRSHFQDESRVAEVPSRLRFFARVAEKVAKKAIQAGVSMQELIPGIKRFFPGGSGFALLDLIRNTDTSVYYNSDGSPCKRERENSVSESPCKRRRPGEGQKRRGLTE